MAQAGFAHRLYQRLLRHPASRPRQAFDRGARDLRPADRRPEQRRLGQTAEGRRPCGAERAGAGRSAGGAGGGRPDRAVRRGHAVETDHPRQAERAGEGRRLYPRAGGRPRDRRGPWRRGEAGGNFRRPQHDLAGRPRPRRPDVNATTAMAPEHPALPTWRDPLAWAKAADVAAVLLALFLPWSTSLVGILIFVWLIAVAPTIELRPFLAHLKSPICVFPLALFALAVVGTLWSDAAWGARLYAILPTTKLLVLPLLFSRYAHSPRAMCVFTAFLISCGLLMVLSWFVAFHPEFTMKATRETQE